MVGDGCQVSFLRFRRQRWVRARQAGCLVPGWTRRKKHWTVIHDTETSLAVAAWICDLYTAADYRWMTCRCVWLVGETDWEIRSWKGTETLKRMTGQLWQSHINTSETRGNIWECKCHEKMLNNYTKSTYRHKDTLRKLTQNNNETMSEKNKTKNDPPFLRLFKCF